MKVVVAPDHAGLRAALADEFGRRRETGSIRPVTVVTTSELAREETRAALGRTGPGALGVRVLSFPTWIRAWAAPRIEAEAGTPLAAPGFLALVGHVAEGRERRARSRGRPGPFADAISTPGFGRALASTLDELARGRLDPESLAAAWGRPLDPIRAELLAVHRAATARLEERRLWTVRREEAAAESALRSAAGGEPDLEPLLLTGFHDLTALQRAIVEAAAARTEITLLVPGPGGAGDSACAPLLDWARERGAEITEVAGGEEPLLTVRSGLFESPTLTDPGPDRLELATLPTEAAEVRQIARRIRREVRENGRGFSDFLVAVPRTGPSPLLFRRIFAAAGIPLDDRAGVPATRTDGGRRALALARALSARRGDAERIALDFVATPEELPEVAADDPVYEDPFTLFTRARDWNESVERFRELHRFTFGEPASAEVDVALDSLAAVHGDAPSRPRDFAALFRAALGLLTIPARLGAGPDESAVLLVRLDAARGCRRPFAFHPGLVEGSVRGAARSDPLLPDARREELNDAVAHAGRFLPIKEDARVEALLLARFAFEAGTERIVLSWAERARTGGERRNPSGLLLDVASTRAGEALDPESARFLEVVPRPEETEARSEPVDATDLDLALLTSSRPPGEPEIARLRAEPRARHLPDALRAAERRWRPGELGDRDGRLLRPRAIAAAWARVDPARRAWSATGIESLLNCPFSFLVERVLGLRAPRDREEDFDAAERGEIFHALLESVYHGLAAAERLPLTAESLPAALERLDAMVAAIEADVAALSPPQRAPRAATLAALRNDIATVLARDALAAETGRAVPTWFELGFGDGEVSDAPGVDLGDGRALPLRGRADRVDLRPDGGIEVVDWKTGRPRGRAGTVTHRSGGEVRVHLQLPLYLEAVGRVLDRRPERALYFHATAEHGFREVPFEAGDLERLRPRIVSLLRHALELARTGWFPCTPGETCCRRDLSAACGPAVAARFRRKVTDPGMAAHLSLLAEDDA